MPFAITQNAGQAKVSITAQFAQGSGEAASFTQQTSAQVEFAIEPSVVGTLPDEPTPDVWTQILSYLSAQDTKIAAIQSDVADIEQVADEANTNADTALTTANKANATATQAKTTADGIDGKATQALAASQTAKQTAQEAKTTADGLADSIAQANTTATQANATAQEAKEIAEGAAQGNGTRVSVGGAFQQTLSFTSDPQTQITQNASAVAATEQSITDIENGTTTVAKANQDGDGNNIADTYAKLSQVVRVDAAQSLTDAQKNTVARNIERSAGRTVNSGGVGWYNILTADITGHFVADLSVVSGYSNSEPTEVKIIAIGGYTESGLTATRASITCFSAGTISPYVSKVRVRKIAGQVCIDIYIPFSTTLYYNDMQVTINSWKDANNAVPQVQPFTFVGTGDGTDNVSICEVIPKGISTNGQIYQQGAPVFATDPSKLAPSTANGWTQTTATGSLPSEGVYMVSFDIQNGGTHGTGILIFGGRAAFVTIGTGLGTYVAYYEPSMSAKWYIADSAYGGNINAVYYKRIA